MIHYLVHPTPLRPLLIVDSGRGISQIDFVTDDPLPLPPDATERVTPLLQRAVTQLTEYFAGPGLTPPTRRKTPAGVGKIA